MSTNILTCIDNFNAYREDIDDSAIVGERRTNIVDGGCTNGNGRGGTSGGGVRSVGVRVSGGYSNMDTSGSEGCNGIVKRRRSTATKRHGDN